MSVLYLKPIKNSETPLFNASSPALPFQLLFEDLIPPLNYWGSHYDHQINDVNQWCAMQLRIWDIRTNPETANTTEIALTISTMIHIQKSKQFYFQFISCLLQQGLALVNTYSWWPAICIFDIKKIKIAISNSCHWFRKLHFSIEIHNLTLLLICLFSLKHLFVETSRIIE